MAAQPGNFRLQSQLYRIYRADIKTVDSFCTALLRENVHLLEEKEGCSLSADFRVLEENEAELLRRKAMRDVLEEFYTRLDSGDELLADTLGFGRDDSSLEELVLTIHTKLQSHAWPERWMEKAAKLWRELPESVEAPVAAGDRLGTLTVSAGGAVVAEVPVLAGETVPRLTWGEMALRLLRSACFAA